MNIAPGTFQGLAQSEVDLFRQVLKGMKGIGVEIGCLDGYSSAVILDASELHLTSIDPFVPDSMELSLIGSKEKYMANVAPWKERAKLIEGYSSQVAMAEGVKSSTGRAVQFVDFLFIDGDHRYHEVLQDFNDWTPLLKTGGILAMHDARMGREGSPNFHEGPSRVARENIFGQPDQWEIVGETFTLVIARKK